jgi:hypothetical protein
MSEFFDPYNADRPLMMKCSCGRDHTVADHHAEVAADEAARELRARSETAEFEAYSNEFIEASLAGEDRPEDRLRADHLRHADHHGPPAGLLRALRPGCRGHQDRRLGGGARQVADQRPVRRLAHAVADAAGDEHGPGLDLGAVHHAGDREHQRPGHHAARSSTRTSATRRTGRASASPCRSTTRCTTSCCATTSRSTASTPTPTSRCAWCRRRRWWPTCAPSNIDGFLGPGPVQPARGVGADRLHSHADQGHLERPSLLRLRLPREFAEKNPNTFAALFRAIVTAATMYSSDPANRKWRSPRRSRRAAYLNQPVRWCCSRC